MRTSIIFVAVTAVLLPSAGLAACPSGYNKTLVTFDTLPVGQAVPNGYPPARPSNWTGFTVVNTSDYGFVAASGTKGILMQDLNAFLDTSVHETIDINFISSFSFGCWRSGPLGSPEHSPVDCDIAIATDTPATYSLSKYRGYGPYHFTSTRRKPDGLSPLTKVDISGDLPPTEIEFIQWNAFQYGGLVLDSIEFCWMHY